jgi:cell pole-organizing protein PopZ
LSALKSVRHETPAQDTTETTPAEPQKAAGQGWNFTRAASPPPAAIKEEIKRVMAPFKDTHFTRMSGPAPAPAALAPPAQAQPAPAVEAQKPAPVQAPTPAPASEPSRPVDFGAIIPARFERPAAVEAEMRAPAQPQSSSFGQPLRPEPQPQTLPSTPLAAVPLGPRPVEAAQLPADPPALPHNPMSLTPPPLTLVSSDASDAHADGQATGTIEDTTAELLRPMLRAWLSDNMPRMVEKALHIEVAESVKTGKKPTGI